jgi:hypothetical protein
LLDTVARRFHLGHDGVVSIGPGVPCQIVARLSSPFAAHQREAFAEAHLSRRCGEHLAERQLLGALILSSTALASNSAVTPSEGTLLLADVYCGRSVIPAVLCSR